MVRIQEPWVYASASFWTSDGFGEPVLSQFITCTLVHVFRKVHVLGIEMEMFVLSLALIVIFVTHFKKILSIQHSEFF